MSPTPGSRRDRTPLLKATVKDQVLAGVAGTMAAPDIRLYVDGVARSFDFAAPNLT